MEIAIYDYVLGVTKKMPLVAIFCCRMLAKNRRENCQNCLNIGDNVEISSIIAYILAV